MNLLLEGLVNVFQWEVLLFLTFGTILGIIIGSLPGLTSTMGVALMLPLTFGMEPVPGILLLIGVYFGSVYGGSLTAILINTPGTPASAATVMDGYPLTQKGQAHKALTISTLSCAIGGIISVLVLILVAPQLASFALKFSAPESFALALFGLSIVSSIAGKSIVKGLMAGTLGLLIATIGLDPIGGFPRFTFGMPEMTTGIGFIPIMIGLFALSEAFKSMEDIFVEKRVNVVIEKVKLKWVEFKGLIGTILRSAGIGTFTGMIPGAGADIAAFVAYNEAKRFAKNKDEFGKGDMRGVAAPEAAGNSVTGGAMIPLLTLGIPGDAVTAVLLGALMVQGLQPGPMLFESNGPIVYTLFVGMLLANVLLLVFGLLGIRFFTKVLLIPKTILTPLIIMLCVVGAYSLGNNYFDVVVMFIAGVVGYFFKKFEIPASPVILGLILGPMMESNLRRALVMSQGDLSIFYTRPITVVLLSIAVITLFTPLFTKKIMKNS
ncbi:tripartite tricarboxylate transporter permease [Sporosarcina koreensis]|uniref:tripartite tricarboxylate transporter permease n=1 Tax=Bacillales TaxID=1385 RepID=UPI0007546241|nr:tripartite tricarboxylate transporter permease [Sporosarcina koreensis]